jgi:hypothetical protein
VNSLLFCCLWLLSRVLLLLLLLVLQVRSILGTFGVLKAFSMLRDAAGKPTGTVLAEFADPGVINAAVAGACAARACGKQWLVVFVVPPLHNNTGESKVVASVLQCNGSAAPAAPALLSHSSAHVPNTWRMRLARCAAGLSVMVIAGQQLHAARAANPESALALQQLIAQQQTALMQRLSGKQAVVPHAAVAAVANSIAAFSAATANLAASAALQQQQAAAAAAPAATAATDGSKENAAAAAAGGGSPGLAKSSSGALAAAAAPAAGAAAAGGCVVRLAAMVDRDELLDDEEYDDIVEDTRTEVAKYGPLKQVRTTLAGMVRMFVPSWLECLLHTCAGKWDVKVAAAGTGL